MARGSFQVKAKLQRPGDSGLPVNALVQLRGRAVDVSTKVDGGGGLIRIGRSVYVEDAGLTGDAKKPWAKLDLDSATADKLVEVADALVADRLFHQVIGGAPYASSFLEQGQLVVDGIDTQRYTMLIDLKKAVAAGALGEYLDKSDLKTLPKQLSVAVWVDANALPRQLEFNLADTRTGNVFVTARFGQFGRRSTVLPPKPAKLGKPSLS